LLNIKNRSRCRAAVFNFIPKHKSTFVFLFFCFYFKSAPINFSLPIFRLYAPVSSVKKRIKNTAKIQRFFAKKSPFFNQK